MSAVRSRIVLCVLSIPAFVLATAFAQADERIIYASIVDKKGAPVLGLAERDFIVHEDGMAREILNVAPDRDPMQVALLMTEKERQNLRFAWAETKP